MKTKELLEHKGYHGTIEPDLEEGDLMGEVLFIRDTLLYRGETVAALQAHFQATVDYYLDSCQRRGKTPDQPVTGTVTLRIDQDLHRAAMIDAARQGVSLNQWVGAAMNKALPKTSSPVRTATRREKKGSGSASAGIKKKAPTRV